MLFTVGVRLMFSLSTIHLANAQGCPNMCACSGTVIECDSKGLTQIPDIIPSSTTELYLYDNSITSIEENAFVGLSSLHTLDLFANSITSVDENAFKGLASLHAFYFSNNPLVCCSVIGFVDWVNGRSLGIFQGTCSAHNETTAILNFNTSDCIVPVDGGWSDWENSTCSVTCGDGTVNMNRECNNPVPSGGGYNCSGESNNTDSCNLGACPESCSTPGKKSDKKSGKGSDNKSGKWSDIKSGKWSDNKSGKWSDNKSGKWSDNKSGKWSDNKSGKWSDNKSDGKRNGKNGKKEKKQNRKGNKPNRNGWY